MGHAAFEDRNGVAGEGGLPDTQALINSLSGKEKEWHLDMKIPVFYRLKVVDWGCWSEVQVSLISRFFMSIMFLKLIN